MKRRTLALWALALILALTPAFACAADGLQEVIGGICAYSRGDLPMQDWLDETDRFLENNRRKVLDGKGGISREAAAKKVGAIYYEFRKKQDAAYISEFDRQTEKYLKGE